MMMFSVLSMTCAKCNHGFCWRCLKHWKPTHKDYYNCSAMVGLHLVTWSQSAHECIQSETRTWMCVYDLNQTKQGWQLLKHHGRCSFQSTELFQTGCVFTSIVFRPHKNCKSLNCEADKSEIIRLKKNHEIKFVKLCLKSPAASNRSTAHL